MTAITIDPERLARITTLDRGSHPPPGDGDDFCGCVMEAAAWVTHRPWSDHPDEDCPIIGAFLRSWNDNLPDEKRAPILLPLLIKVPGSRSTAEVERRRVIMISDWLIRVDTPAWLRLAGLEAQAAALETLPEITDFEVTPPLRAALEAAQRDAEAAARDAWDAWAAWAAWAAWDARDAWDAWDAWAARAARAARDAWDAWDGDEAKLDATIAHLDASAVALIERLIERTEP